MATPSTLLRHWLANFRPDAFAYVFKPATADAISTAVLALVLLTCNLPLHLSLLLLGLALHTASTYTFHTINKAKLSAQESLLAPAAAQLQLLKVISVAHPAVKHCCGSSLHLHFGKPSSAFLLTDQILNPHPQYINHRLRARNWRSSLKRCARNENGCKTLTSGLHGACTRAKSLRQTFP